MKTDLVLAEVPLAPLTSWGIGGSARELFCPSSLDTLALYLKTLSPEAPLYWLGLGSNVLIADEGLPGHVILTHKGLAQLQFREEGLVYAEAGVPCAKLARCCIERSFARAAFFAGIPGTVGGALAMNAGAWGQETWSHILEVTTIDRQGRLRKRSPSDYQIGYRHLKLSQGAPEWFVSALFQFQTVITENPKQCISNLLKQRAATQPIGTRNCGSVFRNPLPEAAGHLIEAAGLKGFRIGDIMVSPKHANFLINLGQATACDTLKMIETIQATVLKEFGIHLEPELRFLNC